MRRGLPAAALAYCAMLRSAFGNSDRRLASARLTRRMKRSPVLALVLLSAVFSFGRTVSDEEIARAVLRAVRSHPGMPNPDTVQVANVVATSEGVCMEYRVTNASGGIREGYAVYKIDKELVYIDNSWIWDASCLAGKYGQRRSGKDLTESVSAALEARKKMPMVTVASVRITSAHATPSARVPSVPVAQPATGPRAPGPAVPARAPAANLAAVSEAPPVIAAAPVPSPQSIVVEARRKPVATPDVTMPAPVVNIAAAPIVIMQTAPPVPTVSPILSAVAPTPIAKPAAAVPVEMGTVRGVTIADPYGALGTATPTVGAAVQESLAEAARRLKKSKQ